MPESRHWRGRSGRTDSGPQPDPYAPSSPRYRERARATVIELAPGMSRIDLGKPIARLAGENQPVPDGAPSDSCEDPVDRLLAELRATPLPGPQGASQRDWRDDYGVAKRP
jgi:hypothetical protein